MHKVIATHPLPGPALGHLGARPDIDLEVWPREPPRGGDALRPAAADGASGLICLLGDTVDAGVLAAGSSLQVVANYAVGYDNIDVDAAADQGIWVTNTPGVLSDATADMAWALMMAAARRVVEGDHLVRSGGFAGWEPDLLLGADIHRRTLGIVGMGRIGRATARRARGFDMTVLYHQRRRLDEADEQALGARYVPLGTLLQEADFVSLHVPYTEQTHHMIDGRALARMKEGAVLVNTARGAVVDERALVKALSEGHLAAAGLDVYEHEPALTPGLAALDNVVLAPHAGSATRTTREKMAAMVVENVTAALAGERPPHAVNEPTDV